MNAIVSVTDKLSLAASTVGADLKSFRSTSVTTENKGNATSKSLLAALVSGVYTKLTATSAILHAFGNPKNAKGKAITTLRGLDNIVGGGAVRKMAETCFTIVENIDADAETVTDSEGNTVGGVIRPAVIAFILGEEGAAKSLNALSKLVTGAVNAYTKATSEEADAADDEASEGEEGNAAPIQSLTDRTLALMVAFEAANNEERSAAYDALAALVEMVNAAIEADADEEAPLAAAA